MNLALIAAGVALVALPGWTASSGRRLQPRDWAHLSSLSLRAGLAAVRIGLLVTATPALLRAVGVHDVADACHELLGPVAPGGPFTSATSLTACAVIQARIVRVRRRCRQKTRRMRIEPWLGQHHPQDGHDLVVVPTAASLAYAVEGEPPQVVVSDGITRTLASDELAAVICHERCHLRHAHQRDLELALVTESAFAPLGAARRSAASLRLAVERWADETAAEETDRASLRSALEKVVVSMLDAVPAFTTAETLLARLDALDAAPRPTPWRAKLAAVTPAVILGATIGAALVTGTLPLHHGVLGLVGYCPL